MELSADIMQYLRPGLIGVGTAVVARWLLTVGRRPSDREVARRLTGAAAPTQRPLDLVAPRRSLDGVADVLARPLDGSPEERDRLSLRLAQAGFRQERAVSTFRAVRLLLAAIGLLAGWLLYARFGPQPPFWYEPIGWVLGGMCLGFFSPQGWLHLAARSRTERIAHALPDSLDMLVVMIEAGLGLDAGIQRCADEIGHVFPDIADEWRVAARETQLGLSRSEAMRRMAARTGVPAMQTLVAILTQAERFGTSIATAMRVHADSLRVKRRQKAEEAAAKMAVKLIFPLVLFIFPTIFIVLAGPAVVQIARALRPG